MSKKLPNLRANIYVKYVLILLAIFAVGCYLTVTKTSVLAQVVTLFSGFLLTPIALDMLFLLLYLARLVISIGLGPLKIGTLAQSGLAELTATRWRASIFVYKLFVLLPLGRYNPYALGLASNIISYVKETNVGAESHGSTLQKQLNAGAVSLTTESLNIVKTCALSDKVDLLTIHTLLAYQCLITGARAQAEEQLAVAVEQSKSMNEKELNAAAESLVIIGETLRELKADSSELEEHIALQTLSAIEQSTVGTDPIAQIKILSSALENLSSIYSRTNRPELAAPLIERKNAIALALSKEESEKKKANQKKDTQGAAA